MLAEKNQRLGFDPADWSAASWVQWRRHPGGRGVLRCVRFRQVQARTLRVTCCWVFPAVNGLGEAFRGGGKVVKNVTGFDLRKLVCGAHGTLCLLTEMTFRVFRRAPAMRRS
ncbi:MAG: hypothetical protein NVV73_12355 [Cellvibrionaceae bacterium]|nr:hypothetical protein [Cellvibrionaceae bacterium]